MKECSKCKIQKDYSCFDIKLSAKDGYRSSCKNCRKTEYLKNKIKEICSDNNIKYNDNLIHMKFCRKCKSFNYNNCKKCIFIRKFAHIKKSFKKECLKFLIPFNDDDYLYFKICKRCISKLEIIKFTNKNSRLCKSCAIDSRKETLIKFHKNNPNAALESRKKSYLKNRNKILERGRLRAKKPEEREKTRKRKALYRKNNITINTVEKKIRHRVSCCIRKAIKKNGNSMKDYLPYSIQELKTHIESQFEPWMTWDNWGKYNSSFWDDNDQSTWTWQIDHIIPQSDLLYDSMEHPNFLKCWDLDNIRPLNSKVNVLDGVNRTRHKGGI